MVDVLTMLDAGKYAAIRGHKLKAFSVKPIALKSVFCGAKIHKNRAKVKYKKDKLL